MTDDVDDRIVLCEAHGRQQTVLRTWYISKQHPDYEQRKAEGRTSVVIPECVACEREQADEVDEVLRAIKGRQPHAPHQGTCAEAHP